MCVGVSKSVHIVAFVSCLLILTSCGIALGQLPAAQETHEPLSSIPINQRARLVERLKLLVRYQSMRQWDKLYDLLTEQIKDKRSRAAFTEQRRAREIKQPFSTLLVFVPTEAIKIDEWKDGGAWFILGCAQFRRGNNTVQIKASVTAELQNNEWFFSEVSAATKIDGPEEPCRIAKHPVKQNRQKAARPLRCLSVRN